MDRQAEAILKIPEIWYFFIMANREPFPYDEDWRQDLPVLIETGVVQSISKHLTTTRPSTTQAVREGLHCRTVWSQWNWSNDGEQFLNVEYRFPSIIFGENETGHVAVGDGPLETITPQVIEVLSELASTRTLDIWDVEPYKREHAVPK